MLASTAGARAAARVLNALLSDAVRAAAPRQRGQGQRRRARRCSSPSSTRTLRGSIWSELETGRDIPRRAATCSASTCARVASALLRPTPTMPADARALLREEARSRCRAQITAAPRSGNRDRAEARAHLAESARHARRGAEGAAGAARRLNAPRPSTESAPRPGASVDELTLAPLDNRALANLCGPLDANLRQIEAALDVAIAHRGGSVHADRRRRRRRSARGRGAAALLRAGGEAAVGRRHPARAGRDHDAARRTPAAAPTTTARRACARAAPICTAARRTRSTYLKDIHEPRHHVRHRPRGHRQDLSRGGLRRRCARARRGQAHRARAAGGRGGRAAGLPARRPRAEGRPVPAPALRRAVRPHGLRQGRRSCSSAARSRSRRSPTCAGARSTTRSSSSTRRRTRRPSR